MKASLKASFRLSLFLAASLLLGACSTSAPLSYEPLNTKIQTDLPALNPTANAQVFSFRLITPIENVNPFAALQATEPISPRQQNTLPVGQLQAVQAAAKKITSGNFLKPEEATVLAFETSRMFNWDPDLARQVLVEVVKIYSAHRDRELKKFRDAAEARAQYFIGKNQAAIDEFKRQNAAIREKFFAGIPNPQPRTVEEQNKLRANYAAHMTRQIEKNRRAQEEYKRQADAYLVKYRAQLDEMAKKAREKEEKAQKLRQAQFEQILAQQKAGILPELPTLSDFAVQNVSEPAPLSVLPLSNGDFMLESNEALPAVITIEVEGFSQPVPIPVLPQTSHGRLLVSISQDAQGRPVVQGGMDADIGATFALDEVVFAIQYDAAGRQMLEFTYPDGRLERFDLAQLQPLASDKALDQLEPERSQLDVAQLEARMAPFAQTQYQFTPELGYMNPGMAVDILAGVNLSL